MQTASHAAKMKVLQPDIFVRPEIHNVRLLDLGKMDEVFPQAEPAMEELRIKIAKLKSGYSIGSLSPPRALPVDIYLVVTQREQQLSHLLH
jgi:hypothetical protein